MRKVKEMIIGGIAALMVAAALAVDVGAQDAVGGALATLAAATRQAEGQRQAGQAAVQAAQWRAMQAATATAQAQDAQAQATRIALDELAGRQATALTATAESYRAQATATALAYGAQAGATATALAQDAAATAAAYDLAYQHSREQAELGRNALYLAAGMLLSGLALVTLAWARALARRFAGVPSARPAWGVVVDALPALPAPSARMPEQMRVINDPELGAQIEAWFYGSDEDENF